MKTVEQVLLDMISGSLTEKDLTLSAKDFVLSKYQSATCVPHEPTQPDCAEKKFAIKCDEEYWLVGLGATEEMAWEDAAETVLAEEIK